MHLLGSASNRLYAAVDEKGSKHRFRTSLFGWKSMNEIANWKSISGGPDDR
jgi:hypothetical protein